MLTSQILIQNHEKTIQRTIDSLVPFGGEIIAADLGSTDKTLSICRRNSVITIKSHGDIDMSQVRNTLTNNSKYDWQLMVEPWEVITDHHSIKDMVAGPIKAYNLAIMKNGLLASETRVWNKTSNWKFKNPVHEFLDVPDKEIEIKHCVVFSDGERKVPLERIMEWRKTNPASMAPIYYEAFAYLVNSQWDKFLAKGEQYLFADSKPSRANIMIKYYMAVVYCHVKRQAEKATRHTLECLAVKPLMAELWCLLGDIHYYLLADYKKATVFYKNATGLGKQRQLTDGWPMEIAKYKNYPAKMIESCEELEDNVSYLTFNSTIGRS